jgi:hypothetical protein
MGLRIPVIAAIFGGIIGLAIGLPLKIYMVDPYFASLLEKGERSIEARQAADNLRRDQLVIKSIEQLDAVSKQSACSGYIGGLKEQGLSVSPEINSACAGG